MRFFLQLAVLAAVGGATAGGWWWVTEKEGAAARDAERPRSAVATLVLVEPVTTSTDRSIVRAIGTGKALQSASLYPQASGEVVEVAFAAQQAVSAGQRLLRLDDEDQRLAVSLAQAAVDEAARQVERLKKLTPSGVVARARMETSQYELQSARLRLAQAQAALKDRSVFAPFDGVVGMTDVDVGDRIAPDMMITTLDDRTSLLVEFTVSEDVAAQIGPGHPVALSAWTLPGQTFKGEVYAMGSRIDPVTRALTVRARITNPDDALRPGTSFVVGIDIVGRVFPAVREVAVLWSRDGAYVWRVAGGKAEKVLVKVIRRENGRVLVDGPLQEGDEVVVEGVQGLRPGSPVTTSPYEQVPTAAGDIPTETST